MRSMEEYRRRESSYDQALGVYQRRIADMHKDTRLLDLESENYRFQEQLRSAEERIRFLETVLRETSPEENWSSDRIERLNKLRASAQELENRIQGLNGNSGGNNR